MAKYQFAEQARKLLEENGVTVNDDGTTGFIKQPEQVVLDGGAGTTEPPQNVNEEATASSSQDNQASEQASTTTVDERDRLIEMQREELEALRAKQAQQSSEQPQKSAREEELERELAELRGQLETKTQAEQADEFRAMLEKQGFNSDELDDDVLLEVRRQLIAPVADKLNSIEQRIAKTEERFREPTAQEKLEQTKARVYGDIKKEIPDFDTIFNSKAFKDKLAEKDDRFPTATFGHALQEALENGRADFIIREVKAFMGGGKDPLAAIADVSGSNGEGANTTPATDTGGYTFSDEEATQMLRAYQMRDISRQEYSEYRSKLDAHRSGK